MGCNREQALRSAATRKARGYIQPVEANNARRRANLRNRKDHPEFYVNCNKFSKGNNHCVGRVPHNKGKTWEERYGVDRATQMRQRDAEQKAKRLQKLSGTDIERRAELYLEESGIHYAAQQPMYGTVVDFYLPETKTVVFTDGCWWHGCPKHYSWFNPQQVAQQKRDRRANELLTASGHRVIRVWGCEIKNLESLLT